MNSGDMQHIAGYSFAEGYAKAIQELEKRTCESCRYFEHLNDKCNMGVMTNWRHEIDSPEHFYCNKWESKE
jgi:hypothetical protein